MTTNEKGIIEHVVSKTTKETIKDVCPQYGLKVIIGIDNEVSILRGNGVRLLDRVAVVKYKG